MADNITVMISSVLMKPTRATKVPEPAKAIARMEGASKVYEVGDTVIVSDGKSA